MNPSCRSVFRCGLVVLRMPCCSSHEARGKRVIAEASPNLLLFEAPVVGSDDTNAIKPRCRRFGFQAFGAERPNKRSRRMTAGSLA